MREIKFQCGKKIQIEHTNELISTNMLLDLGFFKLGSTDESFGHIVLEARIMSLEYFDGSYSFVVFKTSQGIGKMHTIWELLDGFEFVTTKKITDYPKQCN